MSDLILRAAQVWKHLGEKESLTRTDSSVEVVVH